MTPRSNPHPLLRVARAASLAVALLLGSGSIAHAQSMRDGGSIGVSLTILPPVSTQPVRVIGFDVDRNGVATLQTTAPTSASVSQIVMASVVRETAGAATATAESPLAPTMVASPDLRYVVDLGAPRATVARQPVQLRLQYLTVAGT